jgi:hypothetical protein
MESQSVKKRLAVQCEDGPYIITPDGVFVRFDQVFARRRRVSFLWQGKEMVRLTPDERIDGLWNISGRIEGRHEPQR